MISRSGRSTKDYLMSILNIIFELREEQRQQGIISYRCGWWYRSLGALRESCGNEAERAGWDASNEAHPAMVKIGVRDTL